MIEYNKKYPDYNFKKIKDMELRSIFAIQQKGVAQFIENLSRVLNK